MKGKEFNKKPILYSITILLILLNMVSQVEAIPTLSLSPTSGLVATQVTSSGTGFATSTFSSPTQCDVSAGIINCFTPNSPTGYVAVEKITGLTVGGQIESIGTKISSTGTGTFSQALCDEGINPVNCMFQTSGFDGKVHLTKFTGLPVGGTVLSVGISVGSTHAGNIRTKVYSTNATDTGPQNLLGESASTAMVGTGFQNATLSATIPSSGTIWAGAEIDNASAILNYCNCNPSHDLLIPHAYGSGPSPAGNALPTTDFKVLYYVIKYSAQGVIRVKIYSDNGTGTGPSTLLGESNSKSILGTGLQNFTLNNAVTVPSNGNIWAGFEILESTTFMASCNCNPSHDLLISHTYGSGPNPAGTTLTTVSQSFEYVVNYIPTPKTVSFKFDKKLMSSSPSSPTLNSTGGFSGVTLTIPNATIGTHQVNATDGTNWMTATYNLLGLDKSNLSEYWKMDESSGFPINYANQTGSTSACAPFTSPTTGNPAGVFYGQSGIVNKAIGFQLGGASKNTGTGTADSMSGNTEYGIQWTGLQPNSLYNTGTMVFTRSESGNMKLGIYDSTGKLLASSASTPISGVSVTVTTTTPATVPNDGILIFGWLSDSSHLPAGPSGNMAVNATSYPTLLNQNHFVFNSGTLFQNSISYSGSVLQGGQQMKSSTENCGNAQFSTYPNSIFSTGNTTVNLWVKRNQTSSIAQEGGKMTTFCSADNQSVYNGVCLQINKNLSVSYFRNIDTGSGGSMIDNMTSTANFFPNDTNWHMLSAVHVLKSGASSSYTLFYLDGGNAYNATGGSTTNPALPSVSASTQGIMSLGRTTNCANECNYLWGLLDEVSLWWRSLNSLELSQLWNNGQGTPLISGFTVQFKPTLHDNQTQLTSSQVTVTNSSKSQTFTANSTGWVKFTGLSGNQNFTVFDDKNFASLKLVNYNVQSNIAQNLATNDYPINCIGPFSGYQSDFILRINDTSGTHITNISKPDCSSRTDITFSETFTGNGQSGNIFSSSMLTTVTNGEYQVNAQKFTVNGSPVTTTFQGNTNLISNSFQIGSGLTTNVINFDITLGQVTAVNPPPNGSPNVPPPPSPSCTDPLGCAGNSCQYGINPDGTCFDPTCVQGENCNHLQCPPNSTLFNNECLATQPQVCPDGSQPVNGACSSGNPSCPANTVLINGACVITQPTLCPDGTAPVNGLCSNGPVPCPANTVLLNGECVVVSPTNQCALGVNPDGTCITSVQQSQCTANPLLCLLGGGAGGKVTVSGITYTPTVDIVQLGQIKNEVIGVSWDSSSDLIIGGLYFSGNSSFVFNPTPQSPYNLTGSKISTSSSGEIKYVMTVPSSYCSQTITTNCLDPKVSTFVVPVSITAILDGKEVRNTIFLKITVLTQQTIATYLILGLALFAIFAIILSRRSDKKKTTPRRKVQVRTYKNKQQYLSKR